MNKGVGLELADWLEESRQWTEAALVRFVEPEGTLPARLHEAMRYALLGGGKRLRPALVRLVNQHFGGTDEAAALPAVALEMVHTYSLVHDDLPCMDDDELRRGRPTCHVVFGEAMGVLAGDALLTKAFELCSQADAARAQAYVHVLAVAAGSTGMVGGQVLDLESEGSDRDVVMSIHAMKTAALFSAAAEMGAIAGGAGADGRRDAAKLGLLLGLAFQATDDLLDVTGDAATLGKTPGKDAELERLTLVKALGFEEASREAARLTDMARKAALELTGEHGDRVGQLIDYILDRSA
ncbi:MAG: geranylgeranyl pyrophosphate synthase [Planctomycetota bacterium]